MTTRIFIRNPATAEHISAKAAQLGMIFGETEGTRSTPARPGFISAYNHKDALKAAGARWESDCRAWTFSSWSEAEAALDSIIVGAQS